MAYRLVLIVTMAVVANSLHFVSDSAQHTFPHRGAQEINIAHDGKLSILNA